MAITNVTYTLNGQTGNMTNVNANTYKANVTVPDEYGNYEVSVSAYDDSGNVTVAKSVVEISSWIAPKTDWKATDRFNIVDFNRIRNNILHIHGKANKLFTAFSLEDMGNVITSYDGYWEVAYFNAFEANVDLINEHIHKRDYGTRKVFFENGIFIDWQELNRIESALLSMKKIVDDQAEIIRNLSFRLGKYKEVPI